MHFITLILFIIDQTVSPSNIDHWVCFPTGFWPVGLKIVFFLEFTIQTTQGMSLAADRAAPRAGIRTWEGTKTEWVIWKDPGSRQEEEVRTQTCPEGRTGKMAAICNQGERLQKKFNLLTSGCWTCSRGTWIWSWTCSLHNCEKTNSCLSHPVCPTLLGQPLQTNLLSR